MDKEIKELQKKAGQEIKRARLQKGWSQHKLAEKADLSNRHLQQIEDGSKPIISNNCPNFSRAWTVSRCVDLSGRL